MTFSVESDGNIFLNLFMLCNDAFNNYDYIAPNDGTVRENSNLEGTRKLS
jgi:hypothetical protein